MKKKNKAIKEQKVRVPKYKYIIAMVLSIFIAVLPWVSHLKIMNLSEELSNVFTNTNGFNIDFFLYYKEMFIIAIALFIVFFFIGEKIFPDRKINEYPIREKENRIILVLVSIYILCVGITSAFAKYKELTLLGSPTEGEGFFVLIGYMILLLGGINYFCYKKSIKFLKVSLITLMTLIVVVTLVEFLYKPIFEIPFFQTLLAAKQYETLLSSLKTSGFDGMISLAMYNPNYVGAICVLLVPISITNTIFEKNKKLKLWLLLISVGMIFCTFAAKSTAAIYIVMMEVLILTIYFIFKKIITYKNIIIYCMLTVVIFILINIFSNNLLVKNIVEGYKNTPSIINEKEKFILKDIKINNEVLKLVGINKTLVIKEEFNKELEEIKLSFYDNDDNLVIGTEKDNIIKFKEEEFKPISIENVGYGIVVDIGYNDSMNFYVTEDGFKGVGQNGKVIDDISIENRFLTELYPLATGRGYTWVNSLSLLKETLIIGKGPGSFAMNFKQNDYVGLMNTHGSTKFVIDKPHNMYLQTAIQTGAISLITIIGIFIIIIARCSKIYFNKEEKSSESMMGLGILVGVCGFLISSLVYDSIVTVNPIFWLLLGSCYGIAKGKV